MAINVIALYFYYYYSIIILRPSLMLIDLHRLAICDVTEEMDTSPRITSNVFTLSINYLSRDNLELHLCLSSPPDADRSNLNSLYCLYLLYIGI